MSNLISSVPKIIPKTIPIIEISALTPESFAEDYLIPGLPIILTGALEPECDWHLSFLTEQLGDRPFVLRYYGRSRYQQDKRQWTDVGSGISSQTKPFSEYAALLQNGTAHEQDIYLAKCPVQNTPLATTAALNTLKTKLANLGLTRPASNLNLWVGPSGHTEALHYDPSDGTLIQLHGSKRILLFPPSQTPNLYPFPFYVHLQHGMRLRCWFSQVYPDRPDFTAFPNFRTALNHHYDLTLNPGEILYIPMGWWHEVISLNNPTGDEMVCSVNQFWQVYPARRTLFSWNLWRSRLGTICALPQVVKGLAIALLSPNPKQKLQQLKQLF